jgi:hypothetical protein
MTETARVVLVAAAEDADIQVIGAEIPQAEFQPLLARSWASVEASLGDLVLVAAVVHFKLMDAGNLEFCRRLRNLPGRAELPILLLIPGVGRAPLAGEPFNSAMRFPAGPGVLADNLRKVIVENDETMLQALRELKADLSRRLGQVDQQSYYQILDVPQTASRDEITRAYDRLSLRFHPDRLKRIKGEPDTAAQAEQFYDLVSEAYQTLHESPRKQRYDTGLRGGRLRYDPSIYQTAHDFSQITSVDNAKRYLRSAQKELDRGDRQAAITLIQLAIQIDPDNDELKRRLKSLQTNR